MALASVGTINGDANDKTSGTTIVMTTTAAAEAGNLVVLATAWNNTATADGPSTNIDTVTDSAGGNTWTKVVEVTETAAGVADDGVTVAVFYSVLTNTIASGGTITVTVDTARTASAVTAWEFTKDAGTTIAVESINTVQASGAEPADAALSGLTSREYLWFHAMGQENTNVAITQAGWTALTRSMTTGGGSETNVQIQGGFQITTATGITATVSTNSDVGSHVYHLIAFYEVAAGGTTYESDGSLAAGTTAAGADAFTASETGALSVRSLSPGADVFTAAETGALFSRALSPGADVFTASELGSLTVQAFIAGVGVKEAAAAEKAGSLTVGAFVAGLDAFTAAETGSLTARALAPGADVSERSETGSLTPLTQLRGADASTFAEAGALFPFTQPRAADASTFNRLGSLTPQAFLSGVSTKVGSYLKTGSLTVSVVLSGADAATLNRLGSLTPDTTLSGGKIREKTKAGAVTTAGQLRGADQFTASETGSLTVGVFVRAPRQLTLNRTGDLLTAPTLSGTGLHVEFLVTPIPAGWISTGRQSILTRARQGRIDQPEHGTVVV